MDPIVLITSKRFTNDIYFMETVADKIIINDNYQGVMILDNDLNVERSIKLIDDLVIDMAFAKNQDIVLVCYENQCLIHINIAFFNYNIIPLDEKLNEKVFLPLYEWNDNELMLLVDDGQGIVYVDLHVGSLRFVQREVVGEALPTICSDWDRINRFTIHKAYPLRGEAIVEEDNVIKLVGYTKGVESVLKVNSFETEPYYFYDIEWDRDFFLQIGEKVLFLYKGNEIHKFVPKGTNDRFMRSKFIFDGEEICFILLSGSESDAMQSTIEKYCL